MTHGLTHGGETMPVAGGGTSELLQRTNMSGVPAVMSGEQGWVDHMNTLINAPTNRDPVTALPAAEWHPRWRPQLGDRALKLDRIELRLLLAQAADVATFLAFYLLIGPSTHEERNPLILVMMATGGLAMVGLVKMGVTLIVIYRRRKPFAPKHRWYIPLQTIAMSAATASGIAGAGFNLGSLIHAAGIA